MRNIMLYTVGLTYSIIAAIFSFFLLNLAVRKRNEKYFLLSLLMVLASWSGIEWALWLLGYNLFHLVLEPIVPLASFFVAWTLAIIYFAETKFKRRDWVIFLGIVGVIWLIARVCMDCL